MRSKITLSLLALAGLALAQNPMQVTPLQVIDGRTGAAKACSGCQIFTYLAGTNTPSATYTDYTVATPLPNPVLTNSSGYAVASDGTTITGIWPANTRCYKFVLKDDQSVTIWTQDHVCSAQQVTLAFLALPAGSASIGFQQVNGIATTVQAALRNCPFDVQYSSLAVAVANIPTDGCLNVVGVNTLGSGITMNAKSNITIYGYPGSLVKAGASNIILFNLTGSSHIKFEGVITDGNSSTYAGIRALQADAASSYISYENGTLQNFNNNSAGYAAITFNGSHGVFSGNNFLSIGKTSICGSDCAGVTGVDAHYVVIQNNTFTDIQGNAVHFFSTVIAVVPGDFIRVQGNIGHNIARIAVEFGAHVYQKIEVLDNYFDTWTDQGFGISIGFIPGSGVNCTVRGNTINNAAGVSQIPGLGPAFEILADGCVVEGNLSIGDWSGAYILGGHDIKLVHNRAEGALNGVANNNSSYFPINCTIEDNTIFNARDAGISVGGEAASGNKIAFNTVIRTPGYWSDDAGRSWKGIIAGNFAPGTDGNAPFLIQGNEIAIERASIPAGFTAAAFRLDSTSTLAGAGASIKDNLFWNKNATAFGTIYTTGIMSSYAGLAEVGNRYVNALAIGNLTGITTYGDNQSLLGNGSGSAPTDYTITDYFAKPPLSTATPTCVTGTGLDGTGTTNCTGSVTGTLYAGFVILAGAGTPATNSPIFTLTFPASSFTPNPACTFSPGSVAAYTAQYNVTRSTTTVEWAAGATALISGTTYRWNYSCPKTAAQ